MRAVLIKEFGSPDNLFIGEVPTPEPGENELRVRVKATALNRADILQRMGKYPPPPGSTLILGLEMAGVVDKTGDFCKVWKKGDRVMALLPSGGYAEYVTIPCGMALPIPANLSYEEAAAIPEAFMTAYQVLFWIGRFKAGEKVLIHAGASGVGTAAIQLVKDAGGQALITAGSPDKLDFCRKLGATTALNYKEGPFATKILSATGGNGVDIIVDSVGAPYWEQNLEALALDGRIIYIATMGGARIPEVNLAQLFKKRVQITATLLRNRPPDYKIRLTKETGEYILSRFESGKLKPVVDTVFQWQEVQAAHRYMEQNKNMGKIVLRID